MTPGQGSVEIPVWMSVPMAMCLALCTLITVNKTKTVSAHINTKTVNMKLAVRRKTMFVFTLKT